MNWDYNEIVEKLTWGRIDIDEQALPFMLEEARKRHDGDTIAQLARWFEDKEDTQRYLELAVEAAALGSPHANYWLGNEYRWG